VTQFVPPNPGYMCVCVCVCILIYSGWAGQRIFGNV